MKATGIIRRIDDLGRVVIPKEVRRQMKINVGDPLEIYTDREGCVIFKKYQNDELAPFGESVVKALRKNGITASVYNAYGDKVAGNGAYDIDTDLDDECLFAIKTPDDTIGFVSVDVVPTPEDKIIIGTVIDLASAYLDANI
jgi:AbrB family looped-hinge helix DNA binding protein